MRIEKSDFGQTKDGAKVEAYTLYQEKGVFCTLLTYGATLQRLMMPDRKGLVQDVVLGYDTIAEYESENNAYQGAVVGRCGNRIAHASFVLDEKKYNLAQNDGPHHLHGGLRGFDKVIWRADPYIDDRGPAVRFFYHSSDGEEGYPGNLDVQVTYILTADNELILNYDAVSDRRTIVNLTNHSYFNLAGQGSGSILKHELRLDAEYFTAIDDECIPTGEICSVAGTALDFREMKSLGRDINSDDPMIRAGKGYDHNFVLRGSPGKPHLFAEVYEPLKGRSMTVETTMPGVQLYTANFLTRHKGKEGVCYDYRNGLCLETQYYPDAIHHNNFPGPILEARQPYRHQTVYRFSSR